MWRNAGLSCAEHGCYLAHKKIDNQDVKNVAPIHVNHFEHDFIVCESHEIKKQITQHVENNVNIERQKLIDDGNEITLTWNMYWNVLVAVLIYDNFYIACLCLKYFAVCLGGNLTTPHKHFVVCNEIKYRIVQVFEMLPKDAQTKQSPYKSLYNKIKKKNTLKPKLEVFHPLCEEKILQLLICYLYRSVYFI